jgi:hypothetical protein
MGRGKTGGADPSNIFTPSVYSPPENGMNEIHCSGPPPATPLQKPRRSSLHGALLLQQTASACAWHQPVPASNEGTAMALLTASPARAFAGPDEKHHRPPSNCARAPGRTRRLHQVVQERADHPVGMVNHLVAFRLSMQTEKCHFIRACIFLPFGVLDEHFCISSFTIASSKLRMNDFSTRASILGRIHLQDDVPVENASALLITIGGPLDRSDPTEERRRRSIQSYNVHWRDSDGGRQ